jgi:hypothetical protein
LIVVLVVVIVVGVALGTLGALGVIGAPAEAPVGSPPLEITVEDPTDQTDAADPEQTAPGNPAAPAPGLAPSEPDIPAFCDLMRETFPTLEAMAQASPTDSATITEEVKGAIVGVRALNSVAPTEATDHFETGLVYLDSLQEFIETGEQPADFPAEQAAYTEALSLITQVEETTCQ